MWQTRWRAGQYEWVRGVADKMEGETVRVGEGCGRQDGGWDGKSG